MGRARGAGRRQVHQPVDEFFRQYRFCRDSDEKWVNHFECKFCCEEGSDGGWDSLTGTKMLAHICGVLGLGICACSQSVEEIPRGVVKTLLPLFEAGRRFLSERDVARAGKGKTKTRTMVECLNAEQAASIDALLARAHHHHGNLADTFWENEHLISAFKELAAAKPFVYEPPRRKRMGGPLLEGRVKEVMTLVKAIQDDCECITGTMDGWVNLFKLHWLAKSVITKRGSYVHSATDTTGVASMNADWTFKQLEEYIKELGIPLVVALVLDGPNVNKSALKSMEAKHLMIACLLCICHCISIFFKNVYKIPFVKKTFKICNNLGNKFRNVKLLREKLFSVQCDDKELNTLPEFATPKGYLRTSGTRFGSKHSCTELC